MSLKEKGVTLWVNHKELKEITSLEYSITREGPPMFTMGNPDPRSFSQGRSLPPHIELYLTHIAKLGDPIPYGHMTAYAYAPSFDRDNKDEIRIEMVEDGMAGALVIDKLFLADYSAKHVKDHPDYFEWKIRFEGHVKEQTSAPDIRTATNEQLLSMLRVFDDDVLEMKL